MNTTTPTPTPVELNVSEAHERIHRLLGTHCPQLDPVLDALDSHCSCIERDVAYAALDEDDPALTIMPWRPGNSVLDE